jgi:dienelactone hydrolase
MQTVHEIRPLYDGETRLDLYYSSPKDPLHKLPAVLIFSPWSGREQFAAHKADLLAAKNYMGIAVDLYGESRTGTTKEACSALMTPFLEDRQFLKARLHTLIDHLKKDPAVDSEKIAAIGYCFGGLCVLDAVRNNLGLCAGISIHGLYGKPSYPLPPSYTAKVLTLHGQKDPMVLSNDIQNVQEEFQAAGVDWQMITYGQGYHAFTNPEANDPAFGTVFNACLDHRTTHYVDLFLKETLG